MADDEHKKFDFVKTKQSLKNCHNGDKDIFIREFIESYHQICRYELSVD